MSPDDRHNGEYWARGTENGTEHENPAKYMLYRPTASELLAVLATSCEALPPVSAILVYISAAGELSCCLPSRLELESRREKVETRYWTRWQCLLAQTARLWYC